MSEEKENQSPQESGRLASAEETKQSGVARNSADKYSAKEIMDKHKVYYTEAIYKELVDNIESNFISKEKVEDTLKEWWNSRTAGDLDEFSVAYTSVYPDDYEELRKSLGLK